MTFPLSSKTANDVMSLIRRLFGDDAAVQILDSDLISWINMGQLDIATKLQCIQATAVTSSIVGTSAYSVPTDIIKMESVYFNNVPLRATSMDSIQTMIGDTIGTDQADPRYWWLWANMIYVYPVPSTIYPIEINYIKRPANVVNAASSLSLPDTYFNALCEYVMAKAQELDENLQGSQISQQKYGEYVTNLMNIERSESGSFPVVQEYIYD